MNTADNLLWHVPINVKLASIIASFSVKPAWYEAWMALRPQSSGEERLAVYRAIRDSGCLPADAGFFLVSWQIDAMAGEDAEIRLRHLEDRMDSIKRAHGLDEEDFWLPGEEPKEYEALRRDYDTAWDEILLAKLRTFGEHKMARLLRKDCEEFDRQSEAGRRFFHGSPESEAGDAPEWLYALAESVTEHITFDSAAGALGIRWRDEDGVWELVIYPTPVELVGGAEDGAVVAPGLSLDLEGLRTEFEQILACSWQSLGFPDDEGPHVLIEGVYRGHDVIVQVLAYAPDDEEPGMKLDVSPRPR
jgi:hypothetical protein